MTVDFSAWITELSVLRKHRLLIVLVAIGILWWRIFDLPTPPRDPSLKDVDYWSIVTTPNPDLSSLRSLGFIAITVLVFVQIRRISKIAFRVILITVVLAFCVIFASIFVDMSPFSTVEHMMTVTYEDRHYHLAFYTHSRPWDVTFSAYYIFECDSSDHHCSVIYEDAGSKETSKLVVKDDKLFYEYWDRSRQILPKVS